MNRKIRHIAQHLIQIILDDRADDRFLVGEVAVDMANAHAGFDCNFRHAGRMKAMAAKTTAGGHQDLPPSGNRSGLCGGEIMRGDAHGA
jgi:hypothetical protein